MQISVNLIPNNLYAFGRNNHCVLYKQSVTVCLSVESFTVHLCTQKTENILPE